MARIPVDATHGVQNSFQDVNKELRELKKQLDSIDLSQMTRLIGELRKDVSALQSLRRIPSRGQQAYSSIVPLFLNDRLDWSGVFTETQVVSVSSDYTIQGGDWVILVDCTTGNKTITLPLASLKKGRMLAVKKTDNSGNKVIITASGSDLIDGFSFQELFSQYEAVPIISDGVSNWAVL